MRIAIVTDAWLPQINGVVTTLRHTRDILVRSGHDVLMLTPEGRRTMPCPSYPEIRLSVLPGRAIARELDEFRADCIHIATEGTLGLAARRYCLRRRIAFTTAYHTQFPEYIRARYPVPLRWTVAFMRWFHRPAARTMVATRTMRKTLEERGFANLATWSRGVRTDVLTPDDPVAYEWPGPIWIYVGRVSVEKNIEQFLGLTLPGSKVIIGDGPDRERLSAAYPDCHFLGYKTGRDLARHIAGADVFVFPSRTDTFGLVMLEAMACGVPVAALPVTGPIDVVRRDETGCLHQDLATACFQALELNRDDCRQYALSRSWERATQQFFDNLVPADPYARPPRYIVEATEK